MSPAINWVIESTEGVPITLAPIIGDIVHNLRSALDLLAVELVRLNNDDTCSVYFPFAKSAGELKTMIRQRNLDGAAPEAVALVRELKPYPEGNPELRYIHDLDILDKHVMLVPLAGHVAIPGIGLGFERENMEPRILGQGSSLGEWVEPLGLLPNQKLPVRFKLLFPWRGPFEDLELVPTFKHLAEKFSGIVDAFETLCFGAVSQ